MEVKKQINDCKIKLVEFSFFLCLSGCLSLSLWPSKVWGTTRTDHKYRHWYRSSDLLFVFLFLVSSLMTFHYHYTWKNISADCDMSADETTLHTSGNIILQISSNMQYSLDQVFSWYDNNHMVINPIKTKSMITAATEKHQLSPLPLDLVQRRVKIDSVSEHRI